MIEMAYECTVLHLNFLVDLRPNHSVCVCVLGTRVSCAKTAEPIKIAIFAMSHRLACRLRGLAVERQHRPFA